MKGCLQKSTSVPSIDEWLREAKQSPAADKIGMYLTHNGVVRATPKAVVRGEAAQAGVRGGERVQVNANAGKDNEQLGSEIEDHCRPGLENSEAVCGMEFSYDREKALEAIAKTYELPGIYYVKVWMASGELKVGDDIMYVLIGGDIRPHVVDALDFLVGKLKNECVSEREIFKTETE